MAASGANVLHVAEGPPAVTVRRLRPADMTAVAAVERRSFRAEAWPRELLEEYAAEAGAIFLVAVAEGRVVGYSIACSRAERGEVVSLAVVPASRRAGAGRALLESSLRRLRRRRVSRVSLMVRVGNRGAMGLYEAFGFHRVRRVAHYYEDGGDGFLMTRTWL
jgi:[ribosomal protein S18]-alanine N-acetyltransferase